MTVPVSAAKPSVRLEDVVARHRAFWNRKGLLVRTKPYVPVQEMRVPIAGRGVVHEDLLLEPDMLDPHDFLPAPRPRPAPGDDPGCPAMEGDVLVVKGPWKIPWTEAIMGCPIRLVPRSGATWAESFLDDLADLERLRLRPDNPWLRKLVEFTCVLAQHSGRDYCVTHTTMRGPIDMADAMLGTERMIFALVDEPQRVASLLEICAEAFIEAAWAQWAVIPMTLGGHVCRYGVWAPGPVTRTQADAASMLSPRLYRDVIRPYDVRVLRAFPYSIMHTHSAYLHVAEAFLDEDVPSALQVGYDEPPFGPPLEQLIPTLKRFLESKPLIVHGVVRPDDVKRLADALPPDGVLLDLLVRTEAPASDRHIDALARPQR